MKKFCLLLIFSLVISCDAGLLAGLGCVPSDYERSQAKSYYNSWSTVRANISEAEAQKLFGCHYVPGSSEVFSYKTLWGEKLILVNYGSAVIYVERDSDGR